MTPVRVSEVRRYLGVRAGTADKHTEEEIARGLALLRQQARPRFAAREFALLHPDEESVQIEDTVIQSRGLARNLAGCQSAILFAATLGVEADRLISRAEAVRMSEAVVLQACAAAMIEQFCDDKNGALCEEAAQRGLFCRPRFSPGYGDFPLSHQRDFARLLDTPRKLGLTVTNELLLAPVKSVTAVIGLSKTPTDCRGKPCEACDKTDCAFRRMP